MVRTAHLVLGDRQATEDMAQEAFPRLFVHWRKVSHYDRPGAWVRRVTIRLAVREERRRRVSVLERRTVRSSPEGGLDLRRAISALPPKQRVAVVLHYFEDRPIREVAEILECATATARVHLYRARKSLAELLGEEAIDAAR